MGSKKKLLKRVEDINHPGSRKTLATIRDIKRIKRRDEIKKGHALKANVKGLQLAFIAEKIEEKYDSSKKRLTPQEFEEIIESYFHRFDEELEQIKLKEHVNKKRINSHANRANIINMTLQNETQNFRAGGLELPDLTSEAVYQKFIKWDGNAHSIQHIEMRFISKKYLDTLAEQEEEERTMNVE